MPYPTVTPPGAATPKLAKPIATRNALLYWCLFGVAIFIMLGCALISFGGNLLESGPMAFVGAFAAIFLVPVYVCLFLWLDRFEPEPAHLLIAAFIWGTGVAGLFACILNTVVGLIFNAITNNQALAEQLTASISAPIMEEGFKGLAVAILFFWRKSEFDGIIDGIIYAGMIALGFAMIENISYYSREMNHGVGNFVVTYIVRGIMSPYTHVLFTSMTGIGFGISRMTRNKPLKFIAPVAGWMVAMALHCLWNTLPALMDWLFPDAGTLLFLLFYVILWIPLFLVLLSLIAYSLRQESKLIKRYLLEKTGNSPIQPKDAERAARLLPRLIGNINVLITQGGKAWVTLRRYQQATTALAFYRYRLDNGRVQENPDLEATYIGQIVANRPLVKTQ